MEGTTGGGAVTPQALRRSSETDEATSPPNSVCGVDFKMEGTDSGRQDHQQQQYQQYHTSDRELVSVLQSLVNQMRGKQEEQRHI